MSGSGRYGFRFRYPFFISPSTRCAFRIFSVNVKPMFIKSFRFLCLFPVVLPDARRKKRKLIFLPIRLLYQISWSVVKKFTKFLDCKSNFSIFLIFAKAAFLEKWILREGLQGEILLFKWNVLRKTVFHIRQKGVPPLLLPASVLQSPRCLV